MKSILIVFLLTCFTVAPSHAQDWANLNHFKNENAQIGLPDSSESRVVFMGNSITEGWGVKNPSFFSDKPYINRGISGQTTPQMLLRFRADVIDLKPAVVIILAGTNDIAGNTGPSTLKMIMDNIVSMTELALANDIKVVLSSVLPAYNYFWKPELEPAEKIVELNKMIKAYADKKGIVYVDYFTQMADDKNGLKEKYTDDGVHPNIAGYKVMAPLAEEAIGKVLIQE
ncbi:MAG TPA: acylhydrolase [Bacteroidetes bacterium]|nr:acylhydrolase [Bacteroidota bacterium]